MPLPGPRKGETKDDFNSRCMGDSVMNREYPDQDQRYAVCNRLWKTPQSLSLANPATVCISSPSLEAGTPRQKFRKEVIRDGNYVKDGQRFTIDRSLRLHWEQTFREMIANGVQVPVPADHTMKAEFNHGYVVDMINEGDSLFCILDMIGQKGIELAQRNNVSIYSPVEWTDGKGHKYDRPIVHVALTPYPVVPGLAPAEAIAASFSFEEDTPMNWTKIKEALKLDRDITDDTAEELILGALGARDKQISELSGRIEGFTKQISELKLSHEPKKPDKLLLQIAGESRQLKIDKLVPGHISPVVADDLKKIFAEGDGLSLSLSREDPTFDKVLEALAKNKLTEMREKTGPQLLELSKTPSSTSTLVKDAEARAQAAPANQRVW